MTECPIFEEISVRFPVMPDLIFDQMLNDWQHEQAWDVWPLPADYELPPLPIHMMTEKIRRSISASFDTQLMEVIS